MRIGLCDIVQEIRFLLTDASESSPFVRVAAGPPHELEFGPFGPINSVSQKRVNRFAFHPFQHQFFTG